MKVGRGRFNRYKCKTKVIQILKGNVENIFNTYDIGLIYLTYKDSRLLITCDNPKENRPKETA